MILFTKNLSKLQTTVSQEVDQLGLWIKASCVEKLVLTKKVNFKCHLTRQGALVRAQMA